MKGIITLCVLFRCQMRTYSKTRYSSYKIDYQSWSNYQLLILCLRKSVRFLVEQIIKRFDCFSQAWQLFLFLAE